MSGEDADPIRVLHVDDNPDWGDIVAEFLEREHEAITVKSVTNADDALARLDDDPVDCILSDYDMPGMDGLEFLEAVRERDPELPFILFTGKGSEEIASDAISAGVTEYLQKETSVEQYALLANRIERAVAEQRARDALEESERMLSTLISNLPGMVYRCRNERGWPMTFVSEGCRELTGYSPAALETDDIVWGEDIIHPEDRERVWESVQTSVDVGEPFELTYRIHTSDGELRWVWERGSGVFEGGDLVALEGFITDITPRKRREQELRAEREFTDSALNALDDVFFVVDPETDRFLRWNDRLAERTGYSDEELATMSASTLIAEKDRDRVVQTMRDALDSGTEAVTVTADVVLKDGNGVPVEFRGSPLYDDDGDLIGVGAVGRDITDRKERERELEQYRTLVENVGDPMYVLDTDGAIQMVNNAMVEYLGYEREDIVGKYPAHFMPEEHVERGMEIIEELRQTDDEWRTWEMDAIRSDGVRFRNEIRTALIYEDGEFAGSVGVIRDITDRKERERELERFETVIQAVGDPVYALDEDGYFTFVNDAFEPMTGYGADELVGEHIEKIVPEPDIEEGRTRISDLLSDEHERAVKFEIEVRTKDGDRIPSELHMALLPAEDGEFRGTAGIIRDIEDRKRREERLEQFASVVSHDLRGPLNVVLGRVQLAKEDDDPEHLEKTYDAAKRMESLIDDLLTLARQGEVVGEQSDIDLDSVARTAWEGIETADATLETDAEMTLHADPERLQDLFANLMRNSNEHGGPDVTVTVGRLDGESGFYVADDGPGIPETDREAVFEHGYTTDEQGTGFGLAIVERIADAHGWTVALSDSESGGARFDIRTE